MRGGRWTAEGEAVVGLVKLRRLSDKSYLGLAGYRYKTSVQVRVLTKVFEVTRYPSQDTRQSLAVLLNMSPRTIQIWFQNTRSILRARRWGACKDEGWPRPPGAKAVDTLSVPTKYILWLVMSHLLEP